MQKTPHSHRGVSKHHNSVKNGTKKQTRLHKKKLSPHKTPHSYSLGNVSRRFSTTTTTPITRTFRPFGGIDELNASTAKLHIPVGNDVTVTHDEVVKLSQLAYLAPPLPDQKETTKRITNMVNWLSSITHLDVDKLPFTQQYRQKQQEKITKNTLYRNDPTPIPFYTPLILLPQYISPMATSQLHNGMNQSQELTTNDCMLRMRPDIIEVCQANDVLVNAKFTERNFYVAPKFTAGDE